MTPFSLDKPDVTPNVLIDCGFRSAPTEANASRLTSIIKRDYPPVSKLDAEAIEVTAWILSTTRTMEFIGDASQAEQIQSLKNFWTWFWDCAVIKAASYFHPDGRLINIGFVLDESILAEIWPRFNAQVSLNIQDVWGRFFFAAQEIYPAKREMLPDSMLTKEELADPDFLARKSPPGKVSASGRKRKRTTT